MATPASAKAAVRRWGAGTAAIARLLIAAESPLTGVAIAKGIGVTQPRVSQVLRRLVDQGAVTPTEFGYVGDAGPLLDLYEQRARPALVQPETYWYSTRPMPEQARRVVDVAHDQGGTVAFSADLAPDLIVPWRHPTLTVVYTGADLKLDTARLVPAEGRSDASIILRWTSDHTLLSPAAGWPAEAGGLPIADPVQQWWDLLDLGGEDRGEAADRLRREIVGHNIPSIA